MPPPTRQDRAAQTCATSTSLLPVPMAASRSISCTFGKRAKRSTHLNRSGSSMASRSPCTSWTTLPFLRSMDGMSNVTLQAPGSRLLALSGPGSPTRPGVWSLEPAADSSQSHRDPMAPQVRLEISDAVLGVVEDRGGERRVGASRGEHVHEVVEGTGAAGRDDGNRHGVRN